MTEVAQSAWIRAHLESLGDAPLELPDAVWEAIAEDPKYSYVDPVLLDAVVSGDQKQFVCQAMRIWSEPQRKTVGLRHLLATILDEARFGIHNVITREEAQHIRLQYLRDRICDALGLPPVHYRVGRGLRRIGEATVMALRAAF